MYEQTPFDPNMQPAFGTNNIAENPEDRVLCVLLLDISGSMNGEPIRELNEGLILYKDELAADSMASKRVEVAIVTFGGTVDVVVDFTTAEHFHPPQLASRGDTPMGAAINRAIDLIQARKQILRAAAINMYRPWIFLITDGGPTDEWQSAAARIKQGEAAKSFSFYAVGVEGADFERLSQICGSNPPLKLQGLSFRKLFKWLSDSQGGVSRSTIGTDVPVANPTAAGGWATIPT